MNSDTIQALTATFEANAQQTETGVEYWLARDLQHLLGYDEWRNFTTVIAKAKTACDVSGHRPCRYMRAIAGYVAGYQQSNWHHRAQSCKRPECRRW
jgi:hypothetical protein